ncbi:MAG: arsenic efflux protein [Clostridia bacterium]|nr:arsenic efflux protein [Clostridia bacterium]
MTPLFHTHIEVPVHSASGVFDILLDAVVDTLKVLPFLFLAFLLIEFLEHKAQDKIKHLFTRAGSAGPAIGTILGCIPQCGFSVMSANLYASGIITLGTLVAVFLSTSDEAIILLATVHNSSFEIFKLVVTKIIIALIFGYVLYFIEKKVHKGHHHHHSHDLCEHDHCGCDENSGVLRPALIHTVKVFSFLLLFTLLIDLAVAFIGMDKLSHLLLSDSVFQPFLSAIIGFIPNCASSVLLTQLYIEGTLSFGALIAGLCTNAGAGMLILFRDKSKLKENFKIVGIMYICSVIPGIILHLAEAV